MDISGRGLGGKARARRLSHERPSELQRSTKLDGNSEAERVRACDR